MLELQEGNRLLDSGDPKSAIAHYTNAIATLDHALCIPEAKRDETYHQCAEGRSLSFFGRANARERSGDAVGALSDALEATCHGYYIPVAQYTIPLLVAHLKKKGGDALGAINIINERIGEGERLWSTYENCRIPDRARIEILKLVYVRAQARSITGAIDDLRLDVAFILNNSFAGSEAHKLRELVRADFSKITSTPPQA